MTADNYVGKQLPEARLRVASEKVIQRLVQIEGVAVQLGEEQLISEDRRKRLQFDQHRFQVSVVSAHQAKVRSHEVGVGAVVGIR